MDSAAVAASGPLASDDNMMMNNNGGNFLLVQDRDKKEAQASIRSLLMYVCEFEELPTNPSVIVEYGLKDGKEKAVSFVHARSLI